MSFEERNAVSSILVCLVTWSVMLWVLWTYTATGRFSGADGLAHWAQTVLWLIAIGVGIAIVMTVLFNIGYGIFTGERKVDFLSDERDKIIGLRGIQATLIVMTLGVIAAFVALAMNVAILTVLNMILAACAIGSFASEVTKLVLYRRGV